MSRPIGQILSFSYHEDSASLFEKIRHLPYPIFLDSTECDHPQARFDIMTAQPQRFYQTQGPLTYCYQYSDSLVPESASPYRSYREIKKSEIDPLQMIEHDFDIWRSEQPTYDNPVAVLPGIFGYMGYDLGRRWEKIVDMAQADIALPSLSCGFYPWIILVDHLSKTTFIVGEQEQVQQIHRLLSTVSADRDDLNVKSETSFHVTPNWQTNQPFDRYQAAFERTIKHITQGDCYQINLTQRLHNQYQGDPWQGYKLLRRTNPNPYSAFMAVPPFHILSLSPEQFIEVRDNEAKTRPIKGTTQRGQTPATDTQLAEQLTRSAKNRAENLMIVDLLRNDFSKCCLPNTVKVPDLFKLESFPTVHHLVSTVTGKLATSMSPLALVRSCFPGGSITGAPKISAMNIIDTLEPHRRSIYCGSIFYWDSLDRFDSNIAIRTLLCEDQGDNKGQIYCWAGGGIVADSEVEAEYRESYDKIKGLLAAIPKK